MTENITNESSVPAMVISGFRQENDLLYIELPPGKYKIGEEIATCSGYNKTEVLIDLENVDKVFKISEGNVFSHYENIDTKEVKTYKDFLLEKQALDVRQGDPDDEDGLRWTSIKARHAYELFLELWLPVYKPSITYSKVSITITGVPPIVKNSLITPMRKLGGKLDNTLYEYRLGGHINQIIQEEFEKHGWTSLDQKPGIGASLRNMSKRFWLEPGLEFSKIVTPEGQEHFLTIHISDLKQYEKKRVRTGTFEECEFIFNQTEREIRDIMGVFFAKTTPITDLNVATIGKISNDLSLLYNTLLKVDSMKKTYDQYRASMRLIQSIRQEFVKAVNG